MENPEKNLVSGAGQLGLPLEPAAAKALWAYAELLLKWNARVNLTAITDPLEVADKHLLDSLGPLRDLPAGVTRVLDLGAGAGLPGIPWAIARPELQVTLVDAVQKKVAFMKTAIATLGLAPRTKAVHLHATGSESLGEFDVAVSRAFMDVGPWLALATQFLAVGRHVMAFVAHPPSDLDALAAAAGMKVVSTRAFQLPYSRDPRAVLLFQKTSNVA